MANTVVATRGDGIYLLDVGDGQGAVLHTEPDPPQLFPAMSLDGILKFGYWDAFDGDPAPVMEAAARAVHIGPNATGDVPAPPERVGDATNG